MSDPEHLPVKSLFNGGIPFCEKCQRTVDAVIPSMMPGEMIVTVQCHGEEFTISNRHGVLSR